jgi:hypothetical protein
MNRAIAVAVKNTALEYFDLLLTGADTEILQRDVSVPSLGPLLSRDFRFLG